MSASLTSRLSTRLSTRLSIQGLKSWWDARNRASEVHRAAPVRDGLDRATDRVTRMAGFDQALVGVVVALVMLGVVMVYSASVALPDNPKFSRYAPTYFLSRHVLSIALASVVSLAVVQMPISFWEKHARIVFLISIVLLIVVLIPFIGMW